MANISRYTVKDGKIMNQLTKDFRSMGYQVITFGNKVRELQRAPAPGTNIRFP